MARDKYSISFDIKGIEKLAKWQQKLREAKMESDKLEKSLKGLTKSGITSGKAFNSLSKDSAKASAKVGVFTANVKKSKAALTQTTNSLKHNTVATKSNTAATKRATAAKRTNAKGSKMMGSAMVAMGLSVTGAVMAIKALTRFMIGNVKAFAEFEKGVKNVTTLMNADDTGFFKGDLFKGSIELSQDFGFALKDVNQAMFNAVSAGIKGGEAIKFLNDASELAVAGVTSLKSATLGLTTVLNAYGLKASEAARVSSILFTTQKFGVTTVEELSKSLGVVVPFAAASGISLEELGASIAVTTRSGLDAAKTVTALRAAISQMQKPAEKSRDLFIKWGIPIGAAQMKAVGFTETLKRLNKVYKESPRDIELMFGNVRGLTAIFSLAGDNAESYNEILKELEDSQLTAANLEKALAENSDSTAMELAKLTTAWTALKVSMGDSEFISEAVIDLTKLIGLFGDSNISKIEKFNLTLLKGINTIVGVWDVGLIDKAIENYEERLSTQSLQHDVKAAADKIKKAFKDESVSLDDIITVGDAGTMNLLPSDWVGIETLLSQEEVLKDFDASFWDAEGDETKYVQSLISKIAIFKDYQTEYNDILADEKLIKDNINKDAAELAIAYDNFERDSRLALAAEVKSIQDAALTNVEYTSVTELKIAKAKHASIRKLERYARITGGASATEYTSLKIRLGKEEMVEKKKQQAVDSQNTEAYDAFRIRSETQHAQFKQKIATKQNEEHSLSQREFRDVMLQLDIEYFESLLMYQKQYGGLSEKELKKIENKLSSLKIQQANNEVKDADDIHKAKIELAKKAAQMLGQIAQDALDTQLANEERMIERKRALREQEAADGLINQREAAKEQEALDKESFKKKKEHDKKSLTLSYILELAGIAMEAAKNKANAWTFGAAGIFQYAALAGIATARYAGGMATISAQKFADGGLVYGNSHAQGGERFAVGGRVAELEGGEAVINKRSTSMFGGALSAMNVAGGGKSFTAPNLSSGGLIDYNALGVVIGRNTNVVLPVESLNKTQNRVRVIENSVKF